jgi:miniconductance mechanosensitive channel
MAIIPEFGLRIYQAPSGSDLRSLASHSSANTLEH